MRNITFWETCVSFRLSKLVSFELSIKWLIFQILSPVFMSEDQEQVPFTVEIARKRETHARVISQNLTHGNSKSKIRHKNRGGR